MRYLNDDVSAIKPLRYAYGLLPAERVEDVFPQSSVYVVHECVCCKIFHLAIYKRNVHAVVFSERKLAKIGVLDAVNELSKVLREALYSFNILDVFNAVVKHVKHDIAVSYLHVVHAITFVSINQLTYLSGDSAEETYKAFYRLYGIGYGFCFKLHYWKCNVFWNWRYCTAWKHELLEYVFHLKPRLRFVCNRAWILKLLIEHTALIGKPELLDAVASHFDRCARNLNASRPVASKQPDVKILSVSCRILLFNEEFCDIHGHHLT